MQIELIEEASGDTLAWELIDGERCGEFFLSDGAVRYRHQATGELFVAHNLVDFRTAVAAWQRYGAAVRAAPDEEAELRVVAQLRDDLATSGVLAEGGFWSVIVEQAEHGLL
ncbi:MAG: hypothetical protein KC731_24905 [Myxococcales bacterium]|nr:hypothetical protein [Myxococcales bacterium]